MKGNHKPTKQAALAVLESPSISTSGGNLDQLARRANEELDAIKHMERGTALRAIRFGIVMYQIKTSLPRGQFMKWRDEAFPALKKSQASNYMALTLAFVEKTGANLPEVLALPEVQTDLPLDQQQGPGAEILGKAYAFVGDSSLNELLDKHGIKGTKKLGGTRETEEGETAPAIKTAEELSDQYLEEVSAYLENAKRIFIEENALQHLISKPEVIRSTVEGLRALADKVEAAADGILNTVTLPATDTLA
jgi:hypothetical protein